MTMQQYIFTAVVIGESRLENAHGILRFIPGSLNASFAGGQYSEQVSGVVLLEFQADMKHLKDLLARRGRVTELALMYSAGIIVVNAEIKTCTPRGKGNADVCECYAEGTQIQISPKGG